MTLGQKLKQLRKEKDITKATFAKTIGIAPSHVGRYENDESVPTAFILKKIAEFYNVSVDYVLSDDETESPNIVITDKELLKQFEEVSKMTEADRGHIKYFLNVAINYNKMKQMTA
ncbi:MAG TPA: helix-turn-helix transcriptional regulator [Spirochaetota bacterium]|nr:helix-turn-helix transcriptional regulator [Spirochaetota bacterium]HPV99166.1 helix-turn-helix transcriptional regulator [Spirochaetota bacterium]